MTVIPIPDYPANPYAVSDRALAVSGSGEIQLPELVRVRNALGHNYMGGFAQQHLASLDPKVLLILR